MNLNQRSTKGIATVRKNYQPLSHSLKMRDNMSISILFLQLSQWN